MRLTLRQPTAQSESTWRKLFSKSKKQVKSEEQSASESSLPETSAAIPDAVEPATPRASSEYASSLGGPPEEDLSDFSPTSPTSASSPWGSSMPDSPTSSKRFSYSRPATTRPLSLFSFGRGHAAEDIDEVVSAFRAVIPVTQAVVPRQERLVLTMTSKYPTGAAADAYVPVDVSMPGRQGPLRRFTSSRVRPASVMGSRPGSSWGKRTSVMM